MTAAASPTVLPTSEARKNLTSITKAFRTGASVAPVLFGSHRKPEAAIVSYELLQMLDPIIEDLVIAARVKARLAEDDGTRHSLEEVEARLGLDLG